MLTNEARIFGSLRNICMASCSCWDGGFFCDFCTHNCSQLELWYFCATLLAMASTTGYYHRGQVKGRTLVSMKNDWKQISA